MIWQSIETAAVALGIVLLISGGLELLRRVCDIEFPWTVRALIFVIAGISFGMAYRGVKILIQAFKL